MTGPNRYTYPPLQWGKFQGKSARDILLDPDPRYLLSLMKVPTEAGYLRPGLLPWMQQILWDGVSTKEMTLKSREVASSTFWVMEKIRKMLLRPGAKLIIAADVEKNAINLTRYAKVIVESLPDEIRPTIGKNNETFIEFPKLGSYIRALTGKPTSGRSERGKFLICTEQAFWDKADEYYASVQGALVPKTSFDPYDEEIVIESTANTQADLFHDMWFDQENGFKKRFLSVWENPGHTPEWYSQKRREIKDRFLFLREYPETANQAFTGSADTYFNADTVQAGQTRIDVPVESRVLEDGLGWVWIWQRPKVGVHYVIGADVAEGKHNARGKSDWSAAVVYTTWGEHVASIHCKLRDDLFGLELDKLGREYNTAHLAIERNNVGMGTIRTLTEHGKNYPNLYYQTESVPGLQGTTTTKRNVGWLTTPASKSPMLSQLAETMDSGGFVCRDALFWDEAKSFGRAEKKGLEGAHDDYVMATAVMEQARRAYRPGLMSGGGEEDEGRGFGSSRSWRNSMPWSSAGGGS